MPADDVACSPAAEICRFPVVTVALVGPDGAGKSTISRRLETLPLAWPVKVIYMGVNLEASAMMLPTTRLALAVKGRLGGATDMTMRVPGAEPSASLLARSARDVKDALRLALWLAEEWFRQAAALLSARRGAVVVFDRHFLADYVSSQRDEARRWPAKLHEALLRGTYPRPDLVICLDAPGHVLFGRKGEGSPEWLDGRRTHYLQLANLVPRFAVVDATQPLDDVTRDVVRLITELIEENRP